MPIKGLTDQLARERAKQGKSVRLGTIGKGRREGFGRNIKLTDEDYFVFRPHNGDEVLAALFAEVYGNQPAVIPDVRIPVDMAGNFDIEQNAWLTASKHGEKGSTFLARSDGEFVRQARDQETGRVKHYDPGVLSHGDVSEEDKDGRDSFSYNGKFYPWQRSFAVDLLLPDFNHLVFEHAVAGYGVVTLTTHSINDIANLIGEYHGIINELVSMFSNPMKPGDQERARRYLPLRHFPIRLYRSTDKVGTPNWHKDAKPGDRLVGTRSLIHWQLAPEVAAAIQMAIDQRTTNLIAAVAQAPMLTDPVAQANADLFGDPQPEIPAALPETAVYQGPDWDDILQDREPEQEPEEDSEEVIEAIFDESDAEASEPESKIIDLWSSVEEKIYTSRTGQEVVKLSVVADALVKAGDAFGGRRDVWNWLNGPGCADLRKQGVKARHDFPLTPGGARTIWDRGLAHSKAEAEEQ
jgi:hypothetical protein